ncbi:MAG: MFS transporter, partial [Candidatus Paceibacterales bacterium]
EPKDRAKGFGIIGASFGFGFVVGPAISALTVGINPSLPFIIAGIITAIAAILTIIFLPETNKHIGQVHSGKIFDFSKLWHALFDPGVGTTLCITLLFFLAFSCSMMYGFQPFSKHILHLSDVQISVIFVVFGLVGLVSQLFLVQRVAKWLGLKTAFSTSILFVAIAFFCMFFVRTIYFLIAASLLLAFANSIVQPLIQTILSRETDEKSQGSILGINASYQSIGQIFGPILGGLVASFYIPSIFLVGVTLVLVCFYLSFKVMHRGVHKEHAF